MFGEKREANAQRCDEGKLRMEKQNPWFVEVKPVGVQLRLGHCVGAGLDTRAVDKYGSRHCGTQGRYGGHQEHLPKMLQQ
jgi:hypothetical protein